MQASEPVELPVDVFGQGERGRLNRVALRPAQTGGANAIGQ